MTGGGRHVNAARRPAGRNVELRAVLASVADDGGDRVRLPRHVRYTALAVLSHLLFSPRCVGRFDVRPNGVMRTADVRRVQGGDSLRQERVPDVRETPAI